MNGIKIKKILLEIVNNLLYSEYATKIKKYLLPGRTAELFLYPERYKDMYKYDKINFFLNLETYNLPYDWICSREFVEFIQKLDLPIKLKNTSLFNNGLILSVMEEESDERTDININLTVDYFNRPYIILGNFVQP